MKALRALWLDESGQDLLEYVMLLLLIATVVGVAIAAFRGEINGLFGTASTGLQAL